MSTSILGRVTNLARANINSLIDRAEDPEKMLDQLVRDFTSNIADAEGAVAQTVGNLRMLEEDLDEVEKASTEWGTKAVAASRKAEELRAGDKAAEADKFDELAKVALRRQISFEDQETTFRQQVATQTQLTEKLKDGLNRLREKRTMLVQKRDELVSRAKLAKAQLQVQAAVKNVSVMDPTSDLARFEEAIRRKEALARGMAEVAASSLEEQFEDLDEMSDELEVETRLAALKGGEARPQLTAGS
ncbi:MAG: PspA/IM30 family protein [Dehalococcoidia bacterium]